MRLPAGHKLWRILDLRAREYDSIDAFERDFQRRRKAFERMLNDIAAYRSHRAGIVGVVAMVQRRRS